MTSIPVIVTLKNAPRNRSDVARKHCILVDGDTRKLQCKILSKGINKGSLLIEASLGWYSKGCWSMQGCS